MLKSNTERLSGAELQRDIDLLMTNRIHIENGYIRKPAGENTLQQYIFHVQEIRNVYRLESVSKTSIIIQTDAKKIIFSLEGTHGKDAALALCEALLRLRDQYLGLCVATYSAQSYDQPF